jgi:hypothetical protein
MFAFTKLMQAMVASGTVSDPYFYLTTLLLNTSSTNGAQNNTFLDSSSNNFTITRNGNTTQGTFTPFSQTGWSGYFATGQGLTNASALLSTTANTFTGEAWIYLTAASGSATYPSLISFDGQFSSTNLYFAFGPRSDNKLCLYWYDGAGKTAVGGTVLSLNTWYHVACVANAGAIALYVNGVAESLTGTTTLTNRAGTSSEFDLIANFYQTNPCYASNLRVSTTARYTGNFTPSTVPFTNDANTKLLTLQSNRFVDNSSSPYTLTIQSTPSVQAFSPFAPTAAYSTTTVGGSGYFDGTGDMLETPSITIGTNNFCFECWLYPTVSQGSGAGIFTANTNNGLQCSYYATTGLGIAQKGIAYQVNNSNGTIPIVGQWNHVAFVRSGTGTNQTSIFLNGVRIANGTVSYSYAASLYQLSTTNAGGTVFQGYIAGARLTNGSTPYDATLTTLTIPTAPPTAITNTSLLLNFTNSGIYDAAAKNDLETVGNAQVSTTQAKFGTTSMAFDGNGDALAIPNSKYYDFSSGDFTVEFFFRANTLTPTSPSGGTAGYAFIIGQGNWNGTNSGNGWTVFQFNQTIQLFAPASTLVQVAATGNVITSTSTWYHVAIVKSGTGTNNTKIYIDGVQQAQGTPTISNSTRQLMIGGISSTYGWDNEYIVNGYLDEVRITRYARYTTTFTPPTAAFPVQ